MLRIAHFKARPISEAISAVSIGDIFLGGVDPHDAYAGFSFSDRERQRPGSGADIENAPFFRQAGKVHERVRNETAPASHKLLVCLGISEDISLSDLAP